jgi:octaprenyl-diphosphate synthase
MSEGELLQIEKSKKLDIDEETYFEIIKKKTASLISSCCKIAAISVGSKPNQIKKIARLGLNIGISFQIKDDLFDYGKRRIGKPRGIDIKQKKLTLPLIYTINKVERREKKWLISSLKKSKKNKALINQIISLVKETGGLDYAIEKMNMYHELALDELEIFDDSSYKESLTKMINYVIHRNY